VKISSMGYRNPIAQASRDQLQPGVQQSRLQRLAKSELAPPSLKPGSTISGSELLDALVAVAGPKEFRVNDYTTLSAIGQDGTYVSTSSFNLDADLWNPRNGAHLGKLTGHTGTIQCVAALKDGKILTGSSDRTIKVWDVATRTCIRTFSGHSHWVSAVAVTADDAIVTGDLDGELKVWDLVSGECLKTLNTGSRIYSLAIGPNGTIATGHYQRVKFWNPRTLKCVREVAAHDDEKVDLLAIAPNGSLLTGSMYHGVKLWDRSGRCLKEHRAFLESIAINRAGTFLVASGDGTIRSFDSQTGDCTNVLDTGRSAQSIAVGEDGSAVVYQMGKTATLWPPGSDLAE
jgi:WD40 repeat protein